MWKYLLQAIIQPTMEKLIYKELLSHRPLNGLLMAHTSMRLLMAHISMSISPQSNLLQESVVLAADGHHYETSGGMYTYATAQLPLSVASVHYEMMDNSQVEVEAQISE